MPGAVKSESFSAQGSPSSYIHLLEKFITKAGRVGSNATL
jgi:hypothetical protein